MEEFFYGYILKNSQGYFIGRKSAADVKEYGLTKNSKSMMVMGNIGTANGRLNQLYKDLDHFDKKLNFNHYPELLRDFKPYPVYLKIGEFVE